MEFDLQVLFGLLQPPHPPHLGSYTRAMSVSQDRRHLFVTLLHFMLLKILSHWFQVPEGRSMQRPYKPTGSKMTHKK